MEKLFNTRLIVLITMVIFASSCQKEVLNDPNLISEASAGGPGLDNSTGCRLTSFDFYNADGDYHQTETYVYKNGLVDKWYAWFGGVFAMEYNNNGKLVRSGFYIDDALLNTIDFLYEKDKVVHEIWYDGDTRDIADEVYYTYNTKGEMIIAESTNSDYITINTFSANGDLLSWFTVVGGLPYAKGEYVYTKQIKNPLKQRPGIDYEFPYFNSAGFGKSYIASEKITVYDEDGNPFVTYQADPLVTQWHLGYQQFPTLVEYIDKNTGKYSAVTMVMENCGQENAGGSKSLYQKMVPGKIKPGSPGSLRVLAAGSRRGLKQRLAEIQNRVGK
jgi:hypothetical protein